MRFYQEMGIEPRRVFFVGYTGEQVFEYLMNVHVREKDTDKPPDGILIVWEIYFMGTHRIMKQEGVDEGQARELMIRKHREMWDKP